MSRSRDTVTVYLFKKREKSKKSPQIKRFGDFSLAEKEGIVSCTQHQILLVVSLLYRVF